MWFFYGSLAMKIYKHMLHVFVIKMQSSFLVIQHAR